MKIAIVSTPFVPVPPPRYGGTELIVASLVGALAARGHEVTLYATGDSTPGRVELRFHRRTASWPPDPVQELSHAAYAARDIARRGDFDVVHAHVAPLVAMSAFLDVPLVYTVHHARDESLNELYETFQSSALTMVAISRRQRRLLGPQLAPRTHVIHHGLEPDLYPLGDGGPYATFLGRFAEEKGPHTAIDIAVEAGVPLRMAGKPHWKDEAYFSEMVEPRLARPGVTWMGEAAHEQKIELLGGALATLFPIEWEEPFGLVLIELMLCGTPVLAFPRGSAGELIEPGVTGLIAADADEMSWQLRRIASGQLQFDRARCRAHAAHRFSVGRMVERYLEIYAMTAGRSLLGRVAANDETVSSWPLS